MFPLKFIFPSNFQWFFISILRSKILFYFTFKMQKRFFCPMFVPSRVDLKSFWGCLTSTFLSRMHSKDAKNARF